MNVIYHLKEAVKIADKKDLIDLLCKAHTTVGHLNGRHIHVQGYAGHVSFTDFSKRIEQLYQEDMAPMQNRVRDYVEKTSVTTKDFDGHSPLKGFLHLLKLFAPPIVYAEKVVNTATLPYPEMTDEEEQFFSDTLIWRRQVDALMQKQFEISQNEIDNIGSKNLLGNIQKSWDNFLETKNHMRSKRGDDDQKAFNFLVTVKNEQVK